MVSDWLMQIWYRLWKEQKKVILQASISLDVDCILSLKKIITYMLLFVEDWIRPIWRVILLMWITAYYRPYSLLRAVSLVCFYTTMYWLSHWPYIRWINHHVAIIKTIVIPFLRHHHRRTNKNSIALQFTQTRPASLTWSWW
jgi:hypothetical protein